MNKSEPTRLAVIGNGGGGKTTLSRRLSQLYGLPLTHVDSIQFLPGMTIRPLDQTRETLSAVTAKEKWLIDGFGPLDMIEKRFVDSSDIVFVDFPIWRHFWWCFKRQIKSIWWTRQELPNGCNEATVEHTIKLFKTLWRVHKKMRPELLKLLNRPEIHPKVRIIHTLGDWQQVYSHGLNEVSL